MLLVSSCSCLCPIHLSQVLSREWRCSWSSADRRCCNCILVINNLIAYGSAPYIRDLTVHIIKKGHTRRGWICASDMHTPRYRCKKINRSTATKPTGCRPPSHKVRLMQLSRDSLNWYITVYIFIYFYPPMSLQQPNLMAFPESKKCWTHVDIRGK